MPLLHKEYSFCTLSSHSTTTSEHKSSKRCVIRCKMHISVSWKYVHFNPIPLLRCENGKGGEGIRASNNTGRGTLLCVGEHGVYSGKKVLANLGTAVGKLCMYMWLKHGTTVALEALSILPTPAGMILVPCPDPQYTNWGFGDETRMMPE